MAMTVNSAPAASAAAHPAHGNPWFAMVAIALGMIVVLLDGTITAVANPVLAEDLGATLGDLQWITNVYLLALASILVLAGKLGDRFGRKTIFLTGIVGFGIASIGIGASQAVWMVIAWRVVQGLFGALIVTNALALLRETFPADKLPAALGAFAAITGASSAAGPIVGGLVIEHLSWRWAFFINAPVVLLGLLVGVRALRAAAPSPHGVFDVRGVVLLAATMLSFTYAIIRAPEEGWGDTLVIALLVLAVVLGYVFTRVERVAADPLVPLGLFRDRSISAGVLLTVLTFFALLGAMFFVLLFLQQVEGHSPVEAGLYVMPLSIASIVGSGISSALLVRFGPRPPLVAGMLLAAAGMALMTRVGQGASYLDLAVPFATLGLGLGLVMTASIQAIVGNASDEDAGPASGVQQTANQLGGVVGTSVLGAIMAAVASSSFEDGLAERGAPAELVDALGEQGATAVSQGVAPIPPDAPAPLAGVIQAATDAAFVSGMHTTMAIAAGLTAAGALLGLLVRRGRVVEGQIAVH